MEPQWQLARDVRNVLEPYHAIVYFDPEPSEEYERVGLRGPRMGYFASRSAALGRVGPEVVTATFYGFHPGIVARSIPAAWDIVSPDTAIGARLSGVDRALRRRLGDSIDSEDVRRAASIAREVADVCAESLEGRTLFAAHLALGWPIEPHLQLWHAATLFREFRGDGHIAVLLAHEIDACESLVLDAADGRNPAGFLQKVRSWSDAEWASAQQRLASRGVLDGEGAITPDGHRLRETIELGTDRLSAAPVLRLRDGVSDELLVVMARLNSMMA